MRRRRCKTVKIRQYFCAKVRLFVFTFSQTCIIPYYVTLVASIKNSKIACLIVG